MEYKMKFNEVRNAYMNRAGFLMEDFFSDMLYDIQKIENMEKGQVYFFVVQPSCTHIAEAENYDEIRDLCAQFWGNYVIFRIEKIDNEHYTIKNWDKLDKSSYDTKSTELIQKYKDFVLG